jgi:hypothetical protein
MAGAQIRPMRLPTREQLLTVPTPTWVYLLLALVVVVRNALSLPFPGSYFGLDLVLSTTPLLIAAALSFIAPRERLIQISAACFALPAAIRLVYDSSTSVGLFSLGADTRDWANLGPWLWGIVQDVAALTPLVAIVAVLALAFYIGPVRTRTGSLIVAAGAVLTAISVLAAIVDIFQLTQPNLHYSPPPELFIGPFARLQILAWSYLLAVVWERRLRLFAIAAVAQLLLAMVAVLSLFSILSGAAFDQDGQTLIANLLVLASVAIETAFLAAMLLGIWGELPRTRIARHELPHTSAGVASEPTASAQ